MCGAAFRFSIHTLESFLLPTVILLGALVPLVAIAQEPRYSPEGNGNIVIGDPADDPYLPILLTDNPDRLWHLGRPNLLGVPVENEWDFYNLINTDRPDFTDATYTVGRGVTIIETGYTFRGITDNESQNHQARRSLPEALLRVGLNDDFELRVKWNGYAMSNIRDLGTGQLEQIFGADDMIVAFKWELQQQDYWKPMLTLLSGSTLPTGTNGISSNRVQPFINLVGGWGIRRWLYLKTSAGVDWQRISISTLIGGGSVPVAPTIITLRDNVQVYHASASLLFQVSQRIGGFAEFFNLSLNGAEDNRPTNYLDAGFFFYATTNVQFDVRYGVRLSDRVDEFFTGAGLSIRY